MTSPPIGTWRAKWFTEVYTLSARKRNFVPENVTPLIGYEYFIYSKFHKKFYKREITEFTNLEKLKENIDKGLVWLSPNDEIKNKIREDVNDSAGGYQHMQEFRYYTWKLSHHDKHGNKQKDFLTKRQLIIDKLNKL